MTITAVQADRMKRNAHPGPWDSYSVPDFPGEPGYVAVSIGNREIIIPPRESGSGTALDAHLIAAAPDLAQTVIDQAEKLRNIRVLAEALAARHEREDHGENAHETALFNAILGKKEADQ